MGGVGEVWWGCGGLLGVVLCRRWVEVRKCWFQECRSEGVHAIVARYSTRHKCCLVSLILSLSYNMESE